MYVCLCNGLTDHQVEKAVAGGAARPKDVYAACGCRAQCGTCARAILCAIRGGAAAAFRGGASHQGGGGPAVPAVAAAASPA